MRTVQGTLLGTFAVKGSTKWSVQSFDLRNAQEGTGKEATKSTAHACCGNEDTNAEGKFVTLVPGAKVVCDARHHAALKQPKKGTDRHEAGKVGDEGGDEAYETESEDESRYYRMGRRP